MANFKTALEALSKGSIDINSLTGQLVALLDKTPDQANHILAQLDEIYQQKLISNEHYAHLKRQINQYRREHSAETETGEDIENATVFAPHDSPTGSNDTTAVNSDSVIGDADTTQVMGEQNVDATQVMGGSEAQDTAGFDVTGSGDMSGIDVDISAISDPSIASATGTAWVDPLASQQSDTAFGPGSIIKQRFKLMAVLGVGGMGKVYKGLDLLKEEARDKKPYVAIKLLNEDFKDHPEAFISLQRESSRQQKLAHPNIATIYDFDRVGGPGTPVYITMELMEGMELKDHIKKVVKKQGGLPFEEAIKIIRQLVAGLAYAHDRRLVHSDFKPGNCFLCNDGTVKTLDFGIARAVKNPVTGETEKTLFDPGQLGALTPAYASYEMLEGEEPDTRDDTYALGCVSYELLTGRHPFDKLPANKAKANNLKPFIVKGLKKKQNRALQRSVAFLRKDRSPTVEHFLEELEAKYIWYKSPLTIAAAILLIAILGGTAPVINYYEQQKIKQFVAEINTSDPQMISQNLSTLSNFERTQQITIIEDAKTAIQEYFSNKVTQFTDISSDNYNFLQAETVLLEIAKFYPDSNFFEEQSVHVSTTRKQQLSKLYSEFSDALVRAKEQNDTSSLDNTQAILEIIKTRIDPEDSLLTDPRASNQYRVLANNAFDLADYEQALKLISSGLALAPQDEQLADTKVKIEQAIQVGNLEEKISTARQELVSLGDYKTIKDSIIELTGLDPGNSTLVTIATSLKDLLNQELKNILESGQRADAEVLASEYEQLLHALQLNKELIEIKLIHLPEAERNQSIQDIVSNDIAVIEQSLGSPQINDLQWESKMLGSVKELDSLAALDPKASALFTSELENFRNSIITLYIDEAQKILDSKRFSTANIIINRSERFAPKNENILAMRNTIAETEAAHEKQLIIDGLIKDFRAQAEANQIVKAIEYYEQLKSELPEDDVFITKEAPVLLSSSYADLAKNSFEAQDFISALKFADEGLKFNPDNRLLKTDRVEYTVEANIIDLTEQFKANTIFDIADVQRKIGEISGSVKFSEFRQNSINVLAERINSLKTSNENTAAKMAQDAATFFPGSVLDDLSNKLQLQPWPDNSLAMANLNSGKLTEASNILEEVTEKFKEHPSVLGFKKALGENIKRATEAFEQYSTKKAEVGTDYKQLRISKKFLSRAQSLWIDNPDYDTAETELDELIEANKPAAKKVIAREKVDLAASDSGTEQQEWNPVDSDRTCETRLAGYGKRAKAICYDFINAGWRGPLMVVIPTSDQFSNHFAISKYEISIADYGKYCAISKSCTPEKNKEKFNEPLTNISIENARAYAVWVSKRTGKKYRLPTKNEWEYAANADGKQPRKDYNCRVALGDKIVKGTGITSVKSGQSNGWGLKNYIGNVQEWVMEKDKITAKGGAFQDPLSKCDISFSREHDGKADSFTGFRLVLEEIG